MFDESFSRGWISQHCGLNLRAGNGEKGRELAAKLYDCIGRAMADFVTRGIPAAKHPPSPGGDR
jgi:hypothetical protein